MKLKKFKSLLVCAVMAIVVCLPGVLAGCSKSDKDAFTVWLASGEKDQFYMNYDSNPIVKYLNAKEWGPEGEETKLNFKYVTAPSGTQKDNFANLVNGGSYNDIMCLDYAQESILYYYEQDIAMDITDYVNKYMPNYKALVESNPQIYREAVTMVDGEPRYLSLVSINDGPKDMYQGLMYRRDWLVRFGEMPEYVWDWGEDITADKISHELTQSDRAAKAPTITNYFKAKAAYGANESQWTANGWKKNVAYDASKNDESQFTPAVGGTRGCGITSTYGSDAMNDYTDNLIFPSGTNEPVFLSDWEWIFETYETKVWNNSTYQDKNGTLNKDNTYMTSVYYYGTTMRGDFSSCFGKGSPSIYLDSDTDELVLGATEENTRLYLQYMNSWYHNGWLDNDFSSRSSDIFYQIDTKNANAGKVGAIFGKYASQSGNMLENDSLPFTKGIMFVGARLPMNDVVGESANKFVTPDTIYQEGYTSSKCMITTEAEGKNLPALFTYLDYAYTDEGAKLYSLGFDKAQAEETQDEFYKKYNLMNGAYSVIPDDGSGRIYKWADNNPEASDQCSAARANRLPWGLHYVAVVDHGYQKIVQRTVDNWNVYPNKGDIMMQLIDKVKATNEYNNAYAQWQETLTMKMSAVIKASDKTFNFTWNDFKNAMTTPGGTVRDYWQEVYDSYK